jgi:glycosyltransferase involved in cell wall biosynthesis
MRVIHIVHGKANPSGHNGISRVVYHLNKQEKLQGISSEIWAIVDGTKRHYTHKRDEFVTVECFPRVWMPFGSHEIISRIVAEKDTIDLVHFHLIWFFDKNIIAAALKKAGIPFIITTHGTYSKPHAYTGKRLLAKWLFELDFLNEATEVHTITREEATGLQKYGYSGRSFTAYNGMDPAEVPRERRKDFFAGKLYKNKTKLLWVGVLREDKNLRSLIRAVAMLPIAVREQMVCILVGPDYRGNAGKYLSLARELGCADNFDYIGPLYDQDKYHAIESADMFVMPSFSEGFSMALLDAMACAKPSLLTSGCAMNYFSSYDFFIRCEPYPQDIARGLEEAFARRLDWNDMGQNAYNLMNTAFRWDNIAKEMIANYRRIAEAAQ